MKLGFALGPSLLLLTLGCRAGSHPPPVAATPSPCAFAQTDTAGWHEITKDLSDLTFAVPPEFVPDTSVGAKVATYHGGEQLTAPPRAIFYSSFGEGDLRLDGDWVRDSIYQTPDWPTLGLGWRTRIASNDRPKPDDPVVLSAWIAGPAQQLYVVSASSEELADSLLLDRILCTIKLAKEIAPGGA